MDRLSHAAFNRVNEAWEVIDMFAPPREDMFTGGDTYLTR
jgi:hypothetical protein